MKRQRVVVKIGSSSVTDADGRLDAQKMADVVRPIQAAAESADWQLVLVTSGAMAAGSGRLGWKRQGLSLQEKQASAAVGQSLLMETYNRLFADRQQVIGQVLLTKFDLDDPKRVTYICDTMETLMAHDVVPIVNENDTVAVDEIRVGDNDTLAAHVAVLTRADLLVVLTDVAGFYTSDPRNDPKATPIRDVWDITEDLTKAAGSAGTVVGTGGMQTKLLAAKIANQAGIDVIVGKSAEPELFQALADGDWKGTRFHAQRPAQVGYRSET